MTRVFPTPWLAVFVAWAWGVVGALSDLPHAPLHEVQLFFADHAVRDWWGRFDARWFGGVDVTLVPGLPAQLVALVAKLPGLGVERAYALVLALAAAVFGLGVARLARALGGGAGWLVIGAAASPLVWVTLIPGGGLGAVLALGLALNTVAFARTATLPLELAATLALAGGAGASNPLGLVALAVSLPLWSTSVRRAVAVIVGAALGGLASWSALQASVLPGLAVADWVGVAAAIPAGVALVVAVKTRRVVKALVSLAVALLSVFVGALPLEVLPTLALTSTLGLVLLASAEQAARWPGLVATALLFVTTTSTLGWYRNQDTRSRRQALREVEWVLANVPDGERFRFVTLGVGEEWVELSRRVRPSSIDGPGPTSWDMVDLTSEASRAKWLAVLADEAAAVRWVVAGGQDVAGLLEPLGFRSVGAWRGNVTLWERQATAPLPPTARARVKAPWRHALLGPLLGVAALVVLALALAQLRRDVGPVDQPST